MSKIDKDMVDVIVDVDEATEDMDMTQEEPVTKLTVREKFGQFKTNHPKLYKAAKISGIVTLGGAIGFILGVGMVSVSEAKKWSDEPDNTLSPKPNESDDIIDIDATVDPIDVSVVEI